jgi:galactonate dehydratase
MRITKLETYICHAYRCNWVFVRVLTDSGPHGVGEATIEMRELTVAQAIQELERLVVGRDPHAIESIWHDCYRDTYFRGGPILMTALAGVEMALWDIKGKDLGVPVYQLLGGKVREAIPCYANGWFAPARTPDEFAAKAVLAVEAGFKGLKWDPFGSAYMQMDRAGMNAALACIEAVHAAVGQQADLLIEGHGRFDVPTAIRLGQEMERFGIYWFEEPLRPHDKEGYAYLRQNVQVPIATGENEYTKYHVQELLAAGGCDILQPDARRTGGPSEWMEIAGLAAAQHVPIASHGGDGVATHLLMATPTAIWCETGGKPRGPGQYADHAAIEHGYVYAPEAPGFGMQLRAEVLEQYGVK